MGSCKGRTIFTASHNLDFEAIILLVTGRQLLSLPVLTVIYLINETSMLATKGTSTPQTVLTDDQLRAITAQIFPNCLLGPKVSR